MKAQSGQRHWRLRLGCRQGYWHGNETGGGSRRRQNWETLGTAAAELGASGLRGEGMECEVAF